MNFTFLCGTLKTHRKMKKIVLFAFILFSCTAFGQLKKGNVFINGSLSITASKQETLQLQSSTNKTSGFSIMPRVGIFISDKMALGLGIGYYYAKTADTYYDNSGTGSTNRFKAYGLSISPFLRRYFSLGDKVVFFLDGRLNLGFGNSSNDYFYLNTYTGQVQTISASNDTFTTGVALKPGVAFFISPKWGLEVSFANLGFDYFKPTGSDLESYRFTFSHGLDALNFGAAFYFNR
jgi:outer membrane immunogenic protein